eukprot:11040531-Prorocentrum_lima.AAC.1
MQGFTAAKAGCVATRPRTPPPPRNLKSQMETWWQTFLSTKTKKGCRRLVSPGPYLWPSRVSRLRQVVLQPTQELLLPGVLCYGYPP